MTKTTTTTTTTNTRIMLASLLPTTRHAAWEAFIVGETPSIRVHGPIALHVMQLGLDALAMLRRGVDTEIVRQCLARHC